MEMEAKPQTEHNWLHRLIGSWSGDFECSMGPDQPPMKSTATEVVRSLGGLWTIGEADGEMPGGGVSKSIMTLGFDPLQNRFVGTFVASMMSHLWLYNGSLDAAEKVLTLNAEGPKFSGEGLTMYQDIIEFIDDDHRTLSSRVLGDDGNWTHFMTAHYYRKE